MKELLSYIVSNLVTQKEQVSITENKNNGITSFTITVAPDEVGKIIGKGGKIIKAIRTVMRMVGAAINQKIYIEINSPK